MLSSKKTLNVSKKGKGLIFIALFAFLLILVFIFITLEDGKKPKNQETNNVLFNQEVLIGNARVFVAIADNPMKRDRGLSGVPSLKENQGMLFLFKDPGIYYFWMKDMNFDLDFIWIHNNKIVEITENAPAPDRSGYLRKYFPSKTIDSVLEVNAGWVQKNKIELGDEIKI